MSALDDREALAAALLAWFDANQRSLPWRRDRDPYRIWVSEVMLQQTQVATVIPYFDRFLTRFPTLQSLASADEQEVLRHWEGLGYYRRVRHLHAAAKQLTQHSSIPDDPDVWSELPGIGPYMLGAVLSQAFERRLPIVEANSQRVLCRWFAERGDIKSGPTKKWLWQTAEKMLPTTRIGDFNQAVMELGSLICTPTNPRCHECPVSQWCEANRLGIQEQLPTKSAGPEITAVEEVAIVIRRENQVLFVQRPATVRWAGMWEFPRVELKKGESREQGCERLLREHAGLQADVQTERMTIRYGVTRYQVSLICYEAEYRSGEFASSFYVRGEWREPTTLNEYPVSVAQRKLAKAIIKGEHQRRLFE